MITTERITVVGFHTEIQLQSTHDKMTAMAVEDWSTATYRIDWTTTTIQAAKFRGSDEQLFTLQQVRETLILMLEQLYAELVYANGFKKMLVLADIVKASDELREVIADIQNERDNLICKLEELGVVVQIKTKPYLSDIHCKLVADLYEAIRDECDKFDANFPHADAE